MPSDYGYINARLRGRHGRLLPAAAFEELLALPDFPAYVKWMETSPYGTDLHLARVSGEGLGMVERALESSFSAATAAMLKMAEGRPRTLIDVLLLRWDLANLRAVARGIHHAWDSQEIQRSLWPAGTLDAVRLRELTQLRDLQALADTLATWGVSFAQPLSRSLQRYAEGKDLAAVELALEQHYYQRSLRELSGWDHSSRVLHGVLAAEVDIVNARSARRLLDKRSVGPDEAAAYYIDGGDVFDAAAFRGLFDPRLARRTLRGLKGTPFHAYLAADDDALRLEEALERRHGEALARLYRGDPLSIDIALGYLWQKFHEVVNLRLIARGKFYGLSPEQLRPELL